MPDPQPRTSTTSTTSVGGEQTAQRMQVKVDEANLTTSYTNLCRVTGTPEELAIDFGLNMQPSGGGEGPIVFHNRVVMSLYTAKRLYGALQMTLQRHEQLFGPLELDPQKRLVNPPPPKPQG